VSSWRMHARDHCHPATLRLARLRTDRPRAATANGAACPAT
jgi:hypothetical protein